MSISTLYMQKKTALAPPANQETYENVIFEREKSGTNQLVDKEVTDPAFRAPSTSGTYLEKMFQEGSQNS